MAEPLVHVIILNWNRCQDTLACLASLQRSTMPALPITVVDQGSVDDSVQQIHAQFPTVRVIETHQNLGFARGMNWGIREVLTTDATHLLLLNNDTLVAPDMVARLLMHATTDVGVLAPAIFYADRPDLIWSAGGEIHPLLLELRENHLRQQPLPPTPVTRTFFTGCALLVQRQVFDTIGLFDERFFMYYEDLDFCLRIQRAGYRMVLVPDATLWHKVAQSSGGANSPAERYHMALSSGLYFRKHLSGWRAPLILSYRFLSALRWTGRLAYQRQWAALRAYWVGLRAGWAANPTPLRSV
jgi:GT2 family glycosyltransferase